MQVTGDNLLCPKRALGCILRARRDLGLHQSDHLCADLDVAEIAQALKAVAYKLRACGKHVFLGPLAPPTSLDGEAIHSIPPYMKISCVLEMLKYPRRISGFPDSKFLSQRCLENAKLRKGSSRTRLVSLRDFFVRRCKLALHQDNVIKVDWINYTLHTGAGTNVAASNADELSERFDEVNELCAKSRSKVPAEVMKLLSIPFDLEELYYQQDVSMFSSDKEEQERRWHVRCTQANCEAQVLRQSAHPANDGRLKTNQRRRHSQFANEEAQEGADARTGKDCYLVSPLALEQQISNTLTHSDNQGKEAQCALECAQQARANRFLATPPVLRGAWDFGFHIRGLSVAHFQRVTRKTLLDRTTSTVNMTDFSWKNTLPLPTPSAHTQICYANSGLVVSDGLPAAAPIQDEFTLHDPLLSELLYDQQLKQIASLKALLAGKAPAPKAGKNNHREPRQGRSGGVPKPVLRNMPKHGSQSMCMKYISKAGCSGNGTPGQCYNSKTCPLSPEDTTSQHQRAHRELLRRSCS
ncbi:hypothetical protein GQ600_1471 [Phytophthora cactorum]|nr:hypothetical protein GQ600_1471 [Phytophthora cactorum]